jgi:hypothetical protein
MNRKELIDMIENGTSIVRNFIIENDASFHSGSFENWNDGDTIGHIVGWMNYSIDKLSSIKRGTELSDEYSQISDLDDINKKMYDKSKGKSREELETDYINCLGSYIKMVSLFSNNEMDLNTFDTGFKMELWRYMIMDTVIHPVQHIIFQNLKKDQYDKIVEVITMSKVIFEKYSAGNEAYKLSEFDISGSEYQAKLKKMETELISNQDAKEFVQMNRI